MYRWLVFLHLIGVFSFLLAHGGSAAVSFRLKRETERERLRALLQLSESTFNLMYGGLLLILATGLAMGFLGRWWGQVWIWAALGLFVVVAAVMYALATKPLGRLRAAVGLPTYESRKTGMAPVPASQEELLRLLGAWQPWRSAAVGTLGIVAIL